MFDLTKQEYDYIVEQAMLKGDERKLDEILYMRIKGFSRIQIADKLKVSPETVDKRVALLKKKIKKVL